MSAETEQNAASPCDQLLDYAYEELTGGALQAFEAHPAGCAKCQAELAAMKRVRGVVRSAMPMLEPPAAATGGLHAQLLHAAAQRSATKAAPRGKMLAFVRRVATHPGYAAAAGVLIIGGAIGLQWARGGGLMMQPPRAAPVMESAPSPAAAAGAPAPETTAVQAAAPAGTGKDEAPAKAAKEVAAPAYDAKQLQPKFDEFASKSFNEKKKSADTQVFLGGA